MYEHLTLRWTKVLAICTGVLAAATFTVAGLSYKQLLDARRSFAVAQRAFIYLSGNSYQTVFVAHTTPQQKAAAFYAILTNAGNTATRDYTIVLRCSPSIEALPEPFNLLFSEEIKRVPSLVGPRATSAGYCEFTADQLLQMRDGKLHGYIMGEARYHDRLEDDEHVTQFCQELTNVNIDDTQTHLSAISFVPVGKHNCADDECPK
jgi:hypothetical protein